MPPNDTAATAGTTKAPGVRARVRAELTAAIKDHARAQLAELGATGLSLRAIARDLDMASSAIYRYFSSRDELLTALIIDAYVAVGDAVTEADAACDRADHLGRFRAIAAALREWAFANPHEYALIFGSPVPGYEAPEDTIDPAARVPTALLVLVVEARGGDEHDDDTTPADLIAALDGLRGFTGGLLSTDLMRRAVAAWAQLFGMISLDLFGHFNNTVADDGVFYTHAVDALALDLFSLSGRTA